ncbi:MAG: hypothetical protein IPK63_22990 [Candidatus Competibacteraceae bacterium]|nr:hypothetical protein [Candidatus Competibacteraceae bacterium]
MQHLISKLQSPTFKAVIEIARHAGDGMAVTRQASFDFPTCVVQVWEFTPQTPPLERESVRVAVAIGRGRQLHRWTPLAEEFESAVAYYRELAAKTAGQCPPDRLDGKPLAPAVLGLSPPPGVRVTLPVLLAGRPLALAAARERG